MRKIVHHSLWILFASLLTPLPAQVPAFEVASVRLAAPDAAGLGMSGGPGTSDPTHLRYVNVPLYRILRAAYDLMPYDISGPSWMNDARYDVTANIPEGTTPAQFALMLRNLLAERFHLSMHRETREQTVYVLNIGRDGSKLKRSQTQAEQSEFPIRPPSTTTDGFPTPIPGRSMVIRFSTPEGSTRMSGQLQTADQIAQMLSTYVGARVLNKTGLTGKYDFKLEFAGDDSPDATGGLIPPQATPTVSAPSVFSAVQDHLGLRLDRSKEPVEVFVVDRLDRTPVEN